MDTVRTFFVEDMAQVIHRIPISRHGREEFASGHMHGLAFILSTLPTTSQGLNPSTHPGVRLEKGVTQMRLHNQKSGSLFGRFNVLVK
jgi:hypothetical protein